MCCFHYFSLAPPRRRFIIVFHSSMFSTQFVSKASVSHDEETSTSDWQWETKHWRWFDEWKKLFFAQYSRVGIFFLLNLGKIKKNFSLLLILNKFIFIKKLNSKNLSEKKFKKFLRNNTFWFAPPFVSILTSFQLRKSERKSESGERKKCWYPVSMDTKEKHI